MDATSPNYIDIKIASLTHITTTGTSPLWGTLLTHVTPSQHPMNIMFVPTYLVAHMYTPSTLLGCFIPFPSSKVANSGVASGPATILFFFPSIQVGNPMIVTPIVHPTQTV